MLNRKENTNANLIINSARESIKQFIRYEIGLLYLAIHNEYPKFYEYEDVIIYASELIRTPYVGLWVKNYEDEDGVTISYMLSNIKLLLDDSIIIEVESVGGEKVDWEFEIDKLTTDELADIANALQTTYEFKMRDK